MQDAMPLQIRGMRRRPVPLQIVRGRADQTPVGGELAHHDVAAGIQSADADRSVESAGDQIDETVPEAQFQAKRRISLHEVGQKRAIWNWPKTFGKASRSVPLGSEA
jgi:hypothetical protein